MTTPVAHTKKSAAAPRWIPLGFSLSFLLKSPRLLGWSLMLVVLTGTLTWLGYLEAIHLVDGWVGNFTLHPPESAGIQGWFVLKGWVIAKYLFLAVSRVAAFYLAFLIAYCLTCPGYVFLSTATEKKYRGGSLSNEQVFFSLSGMLTDLIEGCKIGLLGLLVTIVALMINFVPLIGQGLVFLLYTFYSALMFVDYPSSNRRWSLGRKISWINRNRNRAFRLGIMPALITLIPVINILFLALLFPLFTVHTTLNFIVVEDG
jgi:CysZ protein